MRTLGTLVALALATGSAIAGQQAPPRDRKPAAAVVTKAPAPERTASERTSPEIVSLQKRIAESPTEVTAYLALAKIQEDKGAIAEAEATLARAREVVPGSKEVIGAVAGFHNRQGNFDKTIAALEALAQLDPMDPARYLTIATFYFDKAQKDHRVTPADKVTMVLEGLTATDRALGLSPDYVEALVYKNLFLRLRGNMEPDAAQRQRYFAEADALRNRAAELKAKNGAAPNTRPSSANAPPPPPSTSGQSYDGMAPVRVGGNIKPPAKIKNVPPVYPEDALASRTQGVVIIEATIDTGGRVSAARVLRSLPMLDQAALDAVRQWEFEPTLLNGQPVPVIMTVTVNFTLQ